MQSNSKQGVYEAKNILGSVDTKIICRFSSINFT